MNLARSLAAALLALPLVAAQAAAREGKIVVGQTFIIGAVDPARGAAGWALVSHGVAEKLFTVDRSGRVVPQIAESAHHVDDKQWIVTLAPGRRFADGSLVDSPAVADSLNRTSLESAIARTSVGRLTFEPIDGQRLRVSAERPAPVLPAVLAEWVFAVYRQTASGFVFTGPWMISGFAQDKSLSLQPNPHFPGHADRPSIELRRFPDAQTLALAMQAGEIDLAFNVPVETLPRLKSAPGISVKSFPAAYQYMMWMNTAKQPLTDITVRRAIDLAISRDDLVRAVNGGVPATGAFAVEFPFASTAPRPHDTGKAARLLDGAGWLLEHGQRRKGGELLTLELVAYPQRPDLITFQPVIKAALKRLGVEVSTTVTENVGQVARDGRFDLLLWAQHTAPAGDPAFFFNLFLRSNGPSNFARLSSPSLDTAIDRLTATADLRARFAMSREIEEMVSQVAPVAFLLTPVWHVAVSPKLAAYDPWGSDYQILRPDLPYATGR